MYLESSVLFVYFLCLNVALCCVVNERQLIYGHVCEINDGPKSDFQNEAKCKIFLVEMRFICMRIKKKIHIKGFACSIPLKKRIEATGKWPIVKSSKPHDYKKFIMANVSRSYMLSKHWLASPQTSFGVRSSRIHFSPSQLRGGEMNT